MSSKNKSNIKSINLRSLILIPRLAQNNLNTMPVLAHGIVFPIVTFDVTTDLQHLRDKAMKIIDINIKRLEKVRNRVLHSSKQGGMQVLMKIDNMISFFKKEKPALSGIKSVAEIDAMAVKIEEVVVLNDIELGKVFDRKDVKAEKGYDKMENKLRDLELKIEEEYVEDREALNKLSQKANHLIEQLRHENAKDKEKFEIKSLRRELTKTLQSLQAAI